MESKASEAYLSTVRSSTTLKKYRLVSRRKAVKKMGGSKACYADMTISKTTMRIIFMEIATMKAGMSSMRKVLLRYYS